MDANRRKLLIVVGVGFVAAVVCTFLFYRMLSGRLVDDAATVQAERTITVASRELPAFSCLVCSVFFFFLGARRSPSSTSFVEVAW